MNIFDNFSEQVTNKPNKIALIYQNKRFTYKEIHTHSLKLADQLLEKGIRKGDKIGLLFNNSLKFALCMLANAMIGAVIVPLNPTTPEQTLKQNLNRLDIEFILKSESRKCTNSFNKKEIISFNLERLKKLAENDEEPIKTKMPYKVTAKSNYLITMTSGSTGEPKPIMLTQRNKIDRSIDGAKELYQLDSTEKIIIASPMFHSLGFRLTLLPLLIGGTGIILPKFRPTMWLEAVEKHSVTFTIAVSSHLDMIINSQNVSDFDLSSIEKIVSSSAKLTSNSKQKLISLMDCEFYECYGTSEIGIATNLSLKNKSKIESVGKPLPYVDIKILDEDNNDQPPNTKGEIACKSKTQFSGYYKRPKKTEDSLSNGYFLTGDMGELDKDGFLYYSGRKNDLIITGGLNVYPKDVEEVILDFSGIEEAAVIGVYDQHFGEAVLAIIGHRSKKIDERELRKHCSKHLSNYQQPMAYEFIEDLPRNEVGKINKEELKQQFSNYDATENIRNIISSDS